MHSDFGAAVRSLVFGLTGTLCLNRQLQQHLEESAAALVAESRGLSVDQGRRLLCAVRHALAEAPGELPSLSRTCLEIGLDPQAFLRRREEQVHPERFLRPDPELAALLRYLGERFDLYVYTNQGYFLADRMLALRGLRECFRQVYSLEFAWRPKPDAEVLQRLLGDIGGPPESFMFIGHRYHIDLREPEKLGSAVLLVHSLVDLQRLPGLLGVAS